MLCSQEELDELTFTIDDYVTIKACERKERVYDSLRLCPEFVTSGACSTQNAIENPCPHRHSKSQRTYVCQYWLQGKCNNKEYCNYLHMYDMTRLPPCYNIIRYGKCNNQECLFSHEINN